MTSFHFIAAGACLVCVFYGVNLSAQESRDCLKAKIRFSTTASKLDYGHASNPGPRIEVTETANLKDRTVSVLAIGPVLDAMISPEVQTRMECSAGGAHLIVTFARSEHYGEATGENQLWRAQVKLDVTAKGSDEVLLRATWTMRQQGSGEDVLRSRAGAYPEQRYPVSLTKTIKSSG